MKTKSSRTMAFSVFRFFLYSVVVGTAMLSFYDDNNKNGIAFVDAEIVTTEKSIKIKEGAFQYYYDDTTTTMCNTIFFLGVGTAMRADSYKTLSTEIINSVNNGIEEGGAGEEEKEEDDDNGDGIIVIVVDDHPHHITKQNPKKYAGIVNEIAHNLSTYIPVCNSGGSSSSSSLDDITILIGGHSASGQGSIDALLQNKLTFKPNGYVGLSPFVVPKNQGTIGIPSLMWGFSKTSCMVSKNKASIRGYEISDPTQRVYYQYQTHNWNFVTGGPHCVYTDKGCPGWNLVKFLKFCHGTTEEVDTIPSAVASSFQVFLEQIKDGSLLTSEPFGAVQINGTKLYVNEQTL